MSENLIYVNGRFVSEKEPVISVFDHGFLYGDGVFEGIRAYNGRVFKLKEHIDRLFDSAKAIDLDVGMTKQKMEEAILETLRVNKLTDAYIRPIVSRGNGDLGLDPRKCAKPNVFIVARYWGSMYGDLYSVGLKGITVGIRRNAPDMLSPNIKSLNYLNNILAKIEANAKGADEAIFLDSNGYVAEGSGDNIFIIKNGEVYTPPTINNLKGITRATAIDLLKEEKVPVHIENISLFDVYTADEIFVTGTAAEAAPVVWVDGRSIGTGKPGPITLKMVKKFEKITGTTGTPIYAAGKAPAKAPAKPASKAPAKAPAKPASKAPAKPAAKKPVAKSAAKKPASNLAATTADVKTSAVKKPAAKPAAKPTTAKAAAKSAVKKPAAKPAAKPETTKAAAKPAAKSATTKAAAAAKSVTAKAAAAAKSATTKATAAAKSATAKATAAAKSATTKAAAKPAAKPATTKAVAKPAAKPATTKAAAKPAAKPATAKASAKPAAKSATTKAAAKPAAKPATTKAAAKPAAKPATTKAAAKPVAKPAVKKPAAKPAAKKPVAKK